ncbi:glutamyl-tRNA synthetase, putative [Eimeria maxima]|uniref:Glutamyl-tRNA synthetase, putative n=1 Tax=Eimeria maxima TaxID=5804 RepID=U6M051_EIMMA|nr:glutamyl-tRNA synthetase, putative [Eimeria maxima]CDJ57577.1 glutamyl-tRNA synthetase, putative [Eimeria maxima]
MENDKLWSINKQIIDPIVPRFMAVDQAEAVEFIIEGGPSTVELKERQLHQKNPNLGFANLYLYNKILIEGDDAKLCEEGEELTKLILREYDHLLTEDKIDEENEESFKLAINKNTLFNTYAIGDPNLQNLHIGDKMQLERRGYFILDKIEGDVRVLIKIPDGKTKAMSVISSKVDAAALVGGKKKH